MTKGLLGEPWWLMSRPFIIIILTTHRRRRRRCALGNPAWKILILTNIAIIILVQYNQDEELHTTKRKEKLCISSCTTSKGVLTWWRQKLRKNQLNSSLRVHAFTLDQSYTHTYRKSFTITKKSYSEKHIVVVPPLFFSLSSEIQGEKPDGSWRLQKRRRKLRDMLGNGRKALKHFARTYICREGCKCMCKNVCNNAHTHNTSVSWTTVNGTCKCLSAMILNQCTISRGDDNNNFNVVDYWQLHRLNSLSVAFVVVP